jgi:type II secretory pathway pseudopilin PulG
MIEMVLALAMVAIIAASLSSVLWTVYHTTKQAEAAVNPSSQASIALEYISGDLANTLQPNTSNNSGTALAGDFEGTQGQDSRGHEADDIQFFSTADSPQHAVANGEIKHFEYLVVQPTGSSDFVLVRRVIRNLLPPSMVPAPDEEVICRGVSSFAVQYFDGSSWNPTWDSTTEDNTIPAAVQIVLQLQETGSDGKLQIIKCMRNVALSTSTAALDTNVNSGTSMP